MSLSWCTGRDDITHNTANTPWVWLTKFGDLSDANSDSLDFEKDVMLSKINIFRKSLYIF